MVDAFKYMATVRLTHKCPFHNEASVYISDMNLVWQITIKMARNVEP